MSKGMTAGKTVATEKELVIIEDGNAVLETTMMDARKEPTIGVPLEMKT